MSKGKPKGQGLVLRKDERTKAMFGTQKILENYLFVSYKCWVTGQGTYHVFCLENACEYDVTSTVNLLDTKDILVFLPLPGKYIPSYMNFSTIDIFNSSGKGIF